MQIATKMKYHLTYNGYCEEANRNKLTSPGKGKNAR